MAVSSSKELIVGDAVIQNPFEWNIVSNFL